LHGARKYDEAIKAYEAGLKVEDSPALKKGLQEVQQAKGALGRLVRLWRDLTIYP
jgi:stress-induced-phosphoprotein 1